jgi:hypothetical protein
MFYIGAVGVLFGAAQSRRLSLGLIALLFVFVTLWISLLGGLAGHGLLVSLREGVFGAWSTGFGVLSGLLLDRLVLHRDQ